MDSIKKVNNFDNGHFSNNDVYINEDMVSNKLMGGILPNTATASFNSVAYTLAPQKYAARTGKDISKVTDVIPEIIKSNKVARNISKTEVGKRVVKATDNFYMENVKGVNQFYNKGKFVLDASSFGDDALTTIAEKTGATVASPKNVLKVAANKANLGLSVVLGVLDAHNSFMHYYDIGGTDEAAKHKGEIGGRLVGSSAGNFLGFVAGSGLTALVSGAATGAAVGGTAGSVVPIAGTIVGIVGGAIVGAVASTFLGDLCSTIGSNIFDGG